MKATPVLGCRFAVLSAVACVLVALAGSIDAASAKSGRETRGRVGQANTPGAPLLAIVSLSDQRVSIYDGDGRRILQSPVSTGQTGLETPAGIFSIVQKKEVHQSNVYEDGNMPFMQRITSCRGAAGPACLARLRAHAPRLCRALVWPDGHWPARHHRARRRCPR
jgi:L,D-transpeptidase-like protein